LCFKSIRFNEIKTIFDENYEKKQLPSIFKSMACQLQDFNLYFLMKTSY